MNSVKGGKNIRGSKHGKGKQEFHHKKSLGQNFLTDEMLIEMFGNLKLNEYSDSADNLVYTAMTVEMENRNLIKFNNETWEYELVK